MTSIRHMNLRTWCAFAVACATLTACGRHSPTAAAAVQENNSAPLHRADGSIEVPAASPLRQRLQVAAVTEQDIASAIGAPGTIEAMPEKLVRITPPLAGRILKIQRSLGDAVKLGEPLFTLDSAELSAAHGEYSKARSALLQARQDLERQKTLFDADIVARKDYEAAQATYDQANSDARSSADKLAQFGASLHSASQRDYVLRSPIAGRVIEMNGAQGGYWNDINAPVMTVADLSTVWLSAGVAEKDVAQVAVGQKAGITLSAYPGQVFDGKVAYVGEVLDPDTRTVKVRVAIANPDGKFRPGMFAHADFTASSHRGLAVPAAALLQNGLYTRVLVERAPLRFEPRVVKAGATLGGQVEIVSGLKAGERIVVKEGVLLND
ncbi:efflux RND transporter periplasmic adaptor subunit [Janthinobacterium agaricidamnosum]|uniref:Membrane fusion protein n=1 Tax=Janthinobacterium agaricidamnosum NBRC 102515 = DSM 9628 TaxID=1349767 RepID=W0V1N3_9BURK|nr:efflux RND transporter periplasmic adaptor subunit [Janthinobacterium agaricidamnosum]CDG81510.1 membrane fusion protein [Janthinobacterium agaricidamnosum NBRC 102515 = DSM 9628]